MKHELVVVAEKDTFKEELQYWWRRYYCPHCKMVTKFMRCDNCGKFFCTEHCDWDNDSTWEQPGQPDYPICYHCC